MKHRILVIDDDPISLLPTQYQLEQWGYLVDTAQSASEGIAKLKQAPDVDFAVILLDYHLPDKSGVETLHEIHACSPESLILCYSGDLTRDTLKVALKCGAVDFIEKGSDIGQLKVALERYCRRYDESVQTIKRRAPRNSNEQLISSMGMVGRSQAMADVALSISKYQKGSKPVLILGETGTGKELVARALHTGPQDTYLVVNCAAYSDRPDLLESELFGHEKGAFTGAIARKSGIFEAARGGTVFLDELHHLSLGAQAKILRAVQEGKIRRVGGTHEYDVAFRLIAASKPTLEERVRSGDFLEDLYFRLNYSKIVVPPLRERPEDIEPLAAFFLEKHSKASGIKRSILVSTIRKLETYSWPGNVRDLESYVYQLVLEVQDPVIRPEHLDARFSSLDSISSSVQSLAALDKKQEAEKRQFILSALDAAPSEAQAAKRLGVQKSTLHSMLVRLGIKRRSTVQV